MDNLEKLNPEAPLLDNPQQDQESAPTEELTKERYKQIVDWSKKEADKYRQMVVDTEVQKASKNANSLLELHEKDPKLAKEVAKWFEFTDFGWYEAFIENNWVSSVPNKGNDFTEEQFEEMYQKRRKKEEHAVSLKKADKLIKSLEGDLQDKAQSYFDKITEGKTLNEESALEFAEMATLYVSRDKLKAWKYDDAMAMLWSNWLSISSSKKSSKDEWPKHVVRNWKLVLISND